MPTATDVVTHVSELSTRDTSHHTNDTRDTSNIGASTAVHFTNGQFDLREKSKTGVTRITRATTLISVVTAPVTHVSDVTAPVSHISAITAPVSHISAITAPVSHISEITAPVTHVSEITAPEPHISEVKARVLAGYYAKAPAIGGSKFLNADSSARALQQVQTARVLTSYYPKAPAIGGSKFLNADISAHATLTAVYRGTKKRSRLDVLMEALAKVEMGNMRGIVHLKNVVFEQGGDGNDPTAAASTDVAVMGELDGVGNNPATGARRQRKRDAYARGHRGGGSEIEMLSENQKAKRRKQLRDDRKTWTEEHPDEMMPAHLQLQTAKPMIEQLKINMRKRQATMYKFE